MGELGALLADAFGRWASALALAPDAGPSAHGWWPFVAIAVAATLSLAVGRSVVLYLNRLRGATLAFALVASLVELLVAALALAGLLWMGATLIGIGPPGLLALTRVVLVALSPLVFSFLTVIALVGPALQRMLELWALLVLYAGILRAWGELGGAANAWELGLVTAVAVLGLMAAQSLAAPSARALRDRGYRRLTGAPLHASSLYLLELAAGEKQ